MGRTKKQLREERKNTGTVLHARWCRHASEPCSCDVKNKRERRTEHTAWCDWPSGLCDCGLH